MLHRFSKNRNNLPIVLIDSPLENELLSQTPGRSGIWGGYQFVVDSNLHQCDYWLPSEISPRNRVLCRSGHAVLITAEPPTIRRYAPRYLAQFSAVVSTDKTLIHPNLIVGQQGIPWHAGWHTDQQGQRKVVRDFDYFKSFTAPNKTKEIAVICSSKSMTQGHKDRIKFVQTLKEEFGDDLDWFGHGFSPIESKWEALHQYRYHLTIENSRLPNYWTEKIADAYLGWCLPIYCGCLNIKDYFPENSFVEVNRFEVQKSVATIQQVLKDDLYETCLPFLSEARTRILVQHNFFELASKILDRLPDAPSKVIDVWPEEKITSPLWRRTASQIKDVFKRV